MQNPAYPIAPAALASAASPSVGDPGANLFVYRETVAPLMFRATIEVDGKAIGAVSNHSFVSARLPAGAHRVSLRWPALAMQTGDSIDVTIPDGTPTYLKVAQSGAPLLAGRLFVLGPKKLVAQDQAVARAAIAQCCRDRSPARTSASSAPSSSRESAPPSPP